MGHNLFKASCVEFCTKVAEVEIVFLLSCDSELTFKIAPSPCLSIPHVIDPQINKIGKPNFIVFIIEIT